MSEYNSSVSKTAYSQKVLNGEIKTGSNSFNNYLSTLDGAEASMSGYVRYLLEANAATLKLKVTTALLNTALNVGIGLIVSGITLGLTKLIHAGEEANKKLQEQQEIISEHAKKYQDVEESTKDLYSQYIKLASTTSNLTSEKKALLDIQEKLNASIGDQTDKVDLLNKSLADNIGYIQEQRKEEARKIIEETQASYDSIKSGLDADRVAMVTYGDRDVEKAYARISEATGLSVSGKLTEQSAQISKMLDAYKQIDGYNVNLYNTLVRGQQAIEDNVTTYTQTVETHEKALKTYAELDLPADKQQRFNELLANATNIIQRFNNATSSSEKFELSQEISDLHYEAMQFVGDNKTLAESVDTVFDAYSQGFSETLGELSTWREAWFKTLDEVQQGGLKNVEMMQNALSTLMSGEGLSGDDFWKLAELDTDKILSDVQMIGDKFYLNGNQVIQLKDAYINKNVEQLKSENQILLAKKKQAEIDALSYQNQLNSFSLTMLDVHNPRYAEYNQQFEQAKHNLDITNQKAEEYGEHLRLNNVLVAQWESGLGAVAKTQDAINKLAKKFQEEADNRLKAQEYKVDQIVDGIEAEKSAIEDAKAALEDQLSILKEQEDELKEITENYEKVANTVQSAIKEQIDNLKAQNEEREEALSLAEKLANLENAKNNKVRTYTEAGGWQYEAKKSDVEKAQREVDKAKVDQEIKVLEEYLKKWEDVTGKRQKAEDEQLAEQILGADWRQKIAKQDEGIFNKYEEEYESYGNQLNHISNIEMQTLQKEIDIKNKEISAKEAQIKEWQKYKSAVQKAASDAKAATSDWYQYLSDITLNEDSTLDERNRNLEEFASTYGELVERIAGYTSQIGDMTASISFDTSGLEDAAEELEEFFNAYREGVMAMADAYNADDNHFGLVNSEWDAKLLKAAKGMQLVHSAATGRVVDYTGLLAVHGTKQKSETIFNANDSKKLYDYIHNTPNVMADMITSGFKIAQNLPNANNAKNSNAVTFNGTTINLPNVQNAEQFARQMEAYMQTVLTESQVYKPRR